MKLLAQRCTALMLISAFRTVSNSAALVFDSIPTIDLLKIKKKKKKKEVDDYFKGDYMS